MDSEKRCVIISSCAPCGIPADIVASSHEAFVICADGGLSHAIAAGVTPDVVIGDFDSVSEDDLSRLPDGGAVEIIRLCPEKDDTDMIAAVKHALSKGLSDFVIVGGLSGRFDHSVGNVQALSFMLDMKCRGWIIDGANRCTMIGSGRGGAGKIKLDPLPSHYFSVLSYTERSDGVTIRNAKYETEKIVFTHSYPRGVSNEFLEGKSAEISVDGGRLLVILSPI
ncbi:MAG: thiamine diphosphokinase [Clostridiales Family XIII bacterium]|jgi:thiamine pyrophosphokinase|nr:thiamine diphosphokinase [Clostridiales Family XIII bacterium]